MNLIDKALVEAVICHNGQHRNHSIIPYVFHPIDVMKQLCKWGIDDEHMLAAALMHDLLEDTNVAPVIIQILDMTAFCFVQELTFDEYLCSKEEYIKSFSEKSIQSLIIKAADRLCNTRDYITDKKVRAMSYLDEAKPLFLSIHDRSVEIVKNYGIVTYRNILNDWDDLSEQLRYVKFA